jgi:WD40 repeat protein
VAELERAYDLDQDEARLPLARAMIEQAKSRDRAGDDDAALAALDRALKVSPNEAEARNMRVTIFTRRGDAALTQKLYDQAVAAYTEAGLPEKISQAEAWRKREMLGGLEKKASEHAQQKNWAAAAEGFESLVQQAEDPESLVTWEKKLAEVRTEQDLAELYAEGATALAERNYTRAQTALQKVVERRPDYRSNGQTAERLLQRAITEGKQNTFFQQLPMWAWALSAVLVLALVVGVTWGVINALSPASTPTAIVATDVDDTATPTSATPNETERTPNTPAPGTTVAPTIPSDTPTPTLTPTPTFPPPLVIEPSNAGNVRPLARLGKGTISQAAYSPDGKLLAVAGSLGIYLYDAQTLEELSLTETSFRDSLAWAPDGQTLVSASFNEPVIQRWQIVKNALALQGSLLGHTTGVRALAFANDGRLAAAGFSRDISLWNVGDNQRARVFPIDGEAESLAFSVDGQWLAVGRKDGVVRVFNVNAQNIESQRFTDHQGEVRALTFSPDGTLLASGGNDDNLVIVRNVTTREEVGRWETFNGNPVRALAFSPDGTRLAAGSFVAVEMFALTSRQGPAEWKQLALDIKSLAFAPDGQTLTTTAQDGILRQWRVSDGTELDQRADFTPEIKSLAYSPQGGLIASGHEDGSVRLWDVGGTAPRLTLNQNLVTPATRALAFSPDGTLLVTGDYQKVKVWQISDGTLLHELAGFNSTVYAIAVSPDGSLLAAGSEDGVVQVWNATQIEAGPVLQQNFNKSIHSLTFFGDGQFLAAGLSGRISVWQRDAWDKVQYDLSAEGSDAILALARSPDNQTLLAASAETDLIQRWNVADGERLALVTLADAAGTLLSAAFSPDGQILVGGISDGSVLSWNAATGEALGALTGHIGPAYAVATSADGRWLASAGNDGTVRLWGIPAVAP